MRHNKNRIHLCKHVLYLSRIHRDLVEADMIWLLFAPWTDMRLHLSGIKNHESRVINEHIVWQPMSLPESGLQEMWNI